MKPISAVLLVVGLSPFTLFMAANAQPVIEFQPDAKWVDGSVVAGRAVAVSVNYANSDHAIVATESGGLFKTTDRGTNWSHLDNLPMFRMRDVKYGPLLPGGGQVVIASGLADSRVVNQGGIWRSTDGGANWTRPDSPAFACFGRVGAWGIAFESGSSNIYVGTDCGLAISRDYGATWTVTNLAPSGDPAIYGVTARGGSQVVDVCGRSGHQRSRDSGVSFGPVTVGSHGGEGVHCIAASPVESSVLFIASGATPAAGCARGEAVYEGDYDSGGAITWTRVSPVFCAAGGRASWVAANRSRDGVSSHFDLYFGTGTELWRQTITRTGGTGPRCATNGWTKVNLDHGDPNGMDFNSVNDCAQFVVSDGGIHRLGDENDPVNCGADWHLYGPPRNGYNAMQIYQVTGQIVYGPGKHVDLYIGTQDNHFHASGDSGGSWPHTTGNEGFQIQVPRYALSDVGQIVTFASMCFSEGCNVNFKSDALLPGGEPQWSNPPGAIIDNPTLIGSGLVGPNVYVQYQRWPAPGNRLLEVTKNWGATWTQVILNPLTLLTWPQVATPDLYNLTLYQAYQKSGSPINGAPPVGVLRITGLRTDGSIFGPKVSIADKIGLGSLGSYSMGDNSFLRVYVFGADPNDPSHLLAPDITTHQMKVSMDGGSTWTPDTTLTELVTGFDPVTMMSEFRFDIPPNEYFWAEAGFGADLQVHVIAFDPYHKGHILVGTEAAGLFRSVNGGASWSAIPDSRKVTAVSSIFFVDEYSHGNSAPEAIVATYGRGLWKVILPPPNPPSSYFRLPTDVRQLWRDGCWLRHTGCLNPDDLLPPGSCDSCHYEAVVGGQITDIIFDPNGGVLGLAINGGRVVASTQDGQPVAPLLPIMLSQTNGPFSACPECAGLVQQGGVIKGVVLENGLLRAIIGGFGPLPGESWLDQFSPPSPQLPPTPDVTAPTQPYLWLVGTVPVNGQPTALFGDTVQAFGSGFCADANCSPVVISLGDQVVANAVPVDANGTFQATFMVSVSSLIATAVQHVGGNQSISAIAPLMVAGGEQEALPELTLSNTGPNLTLSWPADALGFLLEWTTDLANPNSWQTYPGQVITQGGQKIVHLQATGTQGYFRLRRN